MDDQNHLDYSTEGTAPVVVPGSDSVPEPVVAPDNPILLPAPGPGPSKSPMSKQMKVMLGLFSAVILVSGLATSIFLVKQKQDISSKAGSPGDCRCSGGGIICEELDPTPEEPNRTKGVWKGDDPSCQSGPPPAFAPVYDSSGDRTGTAWQSNNSSGIAVGGNTTTQTDDITKATFVMGVNGNEVTNGTSPFTSQGTFGSYTIQNGKLVPSDLKFGQPAPSTCGFKTECKTRADWEKGALDAKDPANWGWMRQTIESTNGDVLKKVVYTDVAQDMDTNKSGHQVGSMVYDSTTGSWKVENIYDIGSQPPATFCKSVETESACWARWLTDGSNNSFTVNPVGTVNSSGQITYNSQPTLANQDGSLYVTKDPSKFPGFSPECIIKDSTSCSGSCAFYSCVNECRLRGSDTDLVCRTGPVLTKNLGYGGWNKSTKTDTKTQCENTYQSGGANGTWCGGLPEKQDLGFCRAAMSPLTCNELFKAKYGFDYSGACELKTSGTSNDSQSGTLTNCDYSSSTINGFKWTWDMYKGFTLIDLGRGAQYARYVCKNQTSLSAKGCNCPETTADKSCVKYTGADALKFNWSQCGVQQIDIDVPISPDDSNSQVNHVSRNIYNESCGTTTTTTFTPTGGPPTGGGGDNPPTTTTFSGPTPTPTTTTNPQLACYQLQIFRGGTQIQPWQINQGDALVFRGFASVSGGAVVSKMRFTVTINGVAQTPVDVNASLVGGLYQADYIYTITQNTSYSVSTKPI